MKKKLLLSSVAALTLFAAYNTASAYERTEPGIKYAPDYSVPNQPGARVSTGADANGNEIGSRTVAEVSGVRQEGSYNVYVDADGNRIFGAVFEDDATVTGGHKIVTKTIPANAKKIGTVRLIAYTDGSTTYTFLPNGQDLDKRATNPYDVTLDKDLNVVKPVKYEAGSQVQIRVQDVKGNPVVGAKVAALVYPSQQAWLDSKKPATVYLTTDENGYAVENNVKDGSTGFFVKEGGYVLFRVDEAPKGYHIPNKLSVGTVFDSEQVTADHGKLQVYGTLVLEKTDSYNVVKEEWVQEEAGWKYYANNKAVTGWKQIDSKWYFFNAEGVMQNWWVQDNGTWYYLNGSGEMQTGWLQDNGTWYYLEASGAMKASQWFEVDSKWYYVSETGALAVNTTVDGYTVNANGEWV